MSFLLEGEVVAVDARNRPLPFQDLMRRFRRVHEIEALRKEIPLRLYLFDVIYLDGRSLISVPYRERWAALERLVPADLLARRIVTGSRAEIEAFLKQALDAGHEGLMAKQLDSTYSVGKRGKKWFKIKPADNLDVAILAAEWGHGRRQGTLSNYWLGVRDGDRWQMIGKTFKGLTDQERLDLMERLISLKTSDEPWVVHVRAEDEAVRKIPARASRAPKATRFDGTSFRRTHARREDPIGSPTRLTETTGAVTNRRDQLYRVCPPSCGMIAIAPNRRNSFRRSPVGAIFPVPAARTKS